MTAVDKMGRVIMQNMKHIRHAPVTVEQCIRNQIAKSRAQKLVTFEALTQQTTEAFL